MNSKAPLLALIFLLAICFKINAQSIDRGPYLQLVTTSSIFIHWRTDSQTDSKVWYGDDPANLNLTLTDPDNTTDHQINITGLSSNTTYYYAVGDSNGQMAGGDNDHYFKTSPNQNTTQTIRAWALGNAGNDHGDQRDVRDGFYDYIGNNHIDLLLLIGDNAYDDGKDSEYQESWFEDMYEDRLISSPMWSTFGNHDGGESDSDDESGPYYDIFNFPKNGQAGGVSSGTEAYYSFDYGNIHFISINSYDIDRDVGEPMYDWVVDDLDDTNQDWIVAFFHYPPYSGTGNNSSDTHPKETDMRENFISVLEAAGVDLVLSAHHHSYQRSFFINGHYDVSDTWDSNTMGIDMGDGKEDGDGAYSKEVGEIGTVYIVSGSAGGVGSDPDGYPAMYTSAQELGSVAIEVTDLQMDVKFIDDNGNIDDYFTIIKEASGPPSVNITNPSDNDFYPDPETILITADATDEGGTVTQVEFFIDDVSIGTDSSSPYSMSWTIPETGSFEIKATATDDDGLSTSHIINIQVGEGLVCVQVDENSDDAEENNSNGSIKLNSGDLELSIDNSNEQTIGMRFNGLGIPQGAFINDAYIQFTVDKDENINPCVLDIYAEASDNAATFSNSNSDITGRPKTSASVSWSPADWENVGDSGPAQKTIDISPVIKEVVDRVGFTSGSSIVIIIEGTGKREAESRNGSTSGAPELCVDFSINEPLPIELLSFNAKAMDEKIKLSWSTASEINNDFFTLERSADGRLFQKIEIIPGKGNSSEIIEYHYFDKNPERGLNYYRLKQTDFDGQFSYSKIVNAEIKTKNHFRVYPSKVSDFVTIEKNIDINEDLFIAIHDLTGRAIKSHHFPSQEKRIKLSLSGLLPGVYYLSLNNSKTKETFKIIKL
jgi:hypothetical protein